MLSEDSQLVVEPHDVVLGTMGSDLSQKGFLLEGLAEGMSCSSRCFINI